MKIDEARVSLTLDAAWSGAVGTTMAAAPGAIGKLIQMNPTVVRSLGVVTTAWSAFLAFRSQAGYMPTWTRVTAAVNIAATAALLVLAMRRTGVARLVLLGAATQVGNFAFSQVRALSD